MLAYNVLVLNSCGSAPVEIFVTCINDEFAISIEAQKRVDD
jgi:hypothetical protein